MYDPATNRWTKLRRAPIGCGGTPIWTGSAVIAYCPTGTAASGLEYVPGASIAPTTSAPATSSTPCTGEVAVGAHPQLPAPAGIASISGLTKVDSDAGGLTPFKGTQRAPGPECTYAATGGVGQFWILTAAVNAYGSADKVPLPIPPALTAKHPGPAEVNVDVLQFRNASSAAALLTNPAYATNSGWTRLPAIAIPGGFIMRVESVANDGLEGFIVQRVVGNTWIEVSIDGAHLSATEAAAVAMTVVVPGCVLSRGRCG